MYGSGVTAVVMSSQTQSENATPNLATKHQYKDRVKDRDARLGAVHDRGGSQYATRNYKRRRSHSPFDPLFASTEQAPQQQKRARHTATNTASSSDATMEYTSWSQSQSQSQSRSPHLPFPQPVFVVPSQVPSSVASSHLETDVSPIPPSPSHQPRPQLPILSCSHLYRPSVPSNAPLGPLSPYRLPPSSQHVTSTGAEASPVPPLPLHQPQPIPPLSRSHHLIVPSNAPLGPLSPYRLPLSSQHVTSTPSWHTPAHSSAPFMSSPRPLPAAQSPPHFSTPVSNPAVGLQLQTPIPLSHRWSSASNPVPAAASRLHRQPFDISEPHSPFHSPHIVASSSGRSHTVAHHHNLNPTFELPTPTPTPFSLPQYHQRALQTDRAHPAPPRLGIFTPFPSPHPMPPEERHNFLDFSLH
ncbi:hypothetical protein EDB83DRAFT_326872 [Lactarius deliciosus]|nr:hypothetical protein EDB83DRAFT_326872 [Lactarius deliciosus]